MPEWLSPVWLVDTVIALTVAEGLALWIFWRRTGRGVAPRDYACNLVSGLCLMLALRCALGAAAPAAGESERRRWNPPTPAAKTRVAAPGTRHDGGWRVKAH
jgi:hypothetical protein